MKDAHRYQKIVLFSGIYNLRPLLDTYIGKAINLNLAEAEALSVVSLDKIAAELLIVVGSDESPKFKEQSQYIAEKYVEKYHAMNISDCYKISLSTMKNERIDETQSTKESLSEKKEEMEEDSFAKKTPIKRLARRSFEIRLKPPVDKEREDYKTFTAIKLPMSETMGDSDFEK
ncbi:unnamed protein product [Onchocerca flexuosa]|uniref:CLASP_N domain-containing protein n=1 Tax=Onchocerca flexuosa TaxID=387005 RepID=A0A183H6F9_9BILA|nr:unnamed protein product [Onchocerca flexuosa]